MRLVILFVAATTLYGSVVAEIRYKLATGDLTSADAIADEFCRDHAHTSECAAAVSWLARGAEMTKQYSQAKGFLERSEALTTELLRTKRVEDDAFLATAVGADIEVRARLLFDQGARDRAIALLQAELPKWKEWAVKARVQKNLNMLSLVGTRAPVLLSGMEGKLTLLFLWGHWCGDCEAQAPVMARIWHRYQSLGLMLIAPNRRNGTMPDKEGRVAESEENTEIERVWKATYSELGDVSHPVDEKAMLAYGVSSTPTIVLVDRKGIVRLYQPYRMSEASLAKQIDQLLHE